MSCVMLSMGVRTDVKRPRARTHARTRLNSALKLDLIIYLTKTGYYISPRCNNDQALLLLFLFLLLL